MKFTLDKCDAKARRARLEFDRGNVETPAFMPVGTYGTVKSVTPEEVAASKRIVESLFHITAIRRLSHR